MMSYRKHETLLDAALRVADYARERARIDAREIQDLLGCARSTAYRWRDALHRKRQLGGREYVGNMRNS